MAVERFESKALLIEGRSLGAGWRGRVEKKSAGGIPNLGSPEDNNLYKNGSTSRQIHQIFCRFHEERNR